MIKAVCTWGEGPDVLLVFESTAFILYEEPRDKHHFRHGIVRKGSADLNMKDAEILAHQLLNAVAMCKQIEGNLPSSDIEVSIPEIFLVGGDKE